MPIKYLPYTPITVEGQAILDNFQRARRVLRYNGNDKPFANIQRGLPLYETEVVETVAPPRVAPAQPAVIPASSAVIPAPNAVIPAKVGIQ